jgi:hypothetical protein
MNSFKMTHTLAILLTFTVIVLALPIYAMMRAITATPTTPIQCPSPESASAKLMRGVTEIAINTEQVKTGTTYYLIDESYLGYPLKVKVGVNSTNTNSTYITNCFNITRLDVNYICGAIHGSLNSLGLTGSFTCSSSAIVIINNERLNEVVVYPASLRGSVSFVPLFIYVMVRTILETPYGNAVLLNYTAPFTKLNLTSAINEVLSSLDAPPYVHITNIVITIPPIVTALLILEWVVVIGAIIAVLRVGNISLRRRRYVDVATI